LEEEEYIEEFMQGEDDQNNVVEYIKKKREMTNQLDARINSIKSKKVVTPSFKNSPINSNFSKLNESDFSFESNPGEERNSKRLLSEMSDTKIVVTHSPIN
jgi:hypothetical protein